MARHLPETDGAIARLKTILEQVESRPAEPSLSTGNRPLPCSAAWGSCRFPVLKALADAATIGHISCQVVHSGRPMFSGRGESPHRR
jgi:hypothetical protein